MSSAPRGANRPRITAFQLLTGLTLLIGISATSLVVLILFNTASSSSESSLVHAPVSGTSPSAPSDKAFLPGKDEAPESTATETPETTPSSFLNVSESEAEPTPENGNGTFTHSSVATPTATPESQPSSSTTQDVGESGTSDPNVSSGSSEPAMRLKIPAIGVNAPVEVKSVGADGVMEDPSSPDAVAWYDFTSRPEDGGNAVFAGHLDYAGVGPAVFWELGSVTNGDEVAVTQPDGRVITYRVTSVRSVPADSDASDIVASSDIAKITIITCDGSFDPSSQEYDQRIIVTGERVT